MDINLSLMFAGVMTAATPVVIAGLGETLTEKAGVINISLDGTLVISAMVAFVVAYETHNLWLGFLAGSFSGAMVGAVLAFFSLHLYQSQVAVGFVLTLTTRDLAYFLGNHYTRLQGPVAGILPLPGLDAIPFIGQVFFNHCLPVYIGYMLIFFCWWYIYKTQSGLRLRAVGEHPIAAYARGINPRKVQFIHTIVGGGMVGFAGATFALATKPGWGCPQGAEGAGWIALALVIFGGWHPVRVACGAYLFAFLQVMGIYFQDWFTAIPAQVFQVAPFPIMIFTLLIMNRVQKDNGSGLKAEGSIKGYIRRLFAGSAPDALGQTYKLERI